MIYSETINGIRVTSGDVICTTDGTDKSLMGKAWQMVGLLVPGRIDHTIVYIGPNGGCIEAGGKGVIYFEMPNQTWNAESVAATRLLHDSFVGVAYPLQGRNLSAQREAEIRKQVVQFCMEQLGKPYNINFFAPDLDAAFYCSQLIYQAYAAQGIDLLQNHTRVEAGELPLVITPQMIWDSTIHQAVIPSPP